MAPIKFASLQPYNQEMKTCNQNKGAMPNFFKLCILASMQASATLCLGTTECVAYNDFSGFVFTMKYRYY